MDKDLIIWKNEAELLKENIKEEFKKHYKCLGLNLICETENELLKGIHISLVENKLKLRKEFFVDLKGFYSINDYKDYIMITINDLLEEMIKNYYTI